MRNTMTLVAAVLVFAGGLLLVPATQRASAGNIKQIGLAIHNYGDYSEPAPDRLLANSSDALPGLLWTEKDEVVETVATQVRDNDFIFIQLGTGETVPATVVWSDADDLLLMDADGGLALFIIL